MFRVSSVIVLVPFSLYIIEKIVKPKVSLVAAGYLVLIITMVWIFERISMYDLETNIVNSIEGLKEYGYLLFDEKNRYVGGNKYIKELYPEISKWRIDTLIKEENNDVYKDILSYLYAYKEGESEPKTIEKADKYFEIHCREIKYRRRKDKGHIIELIDRTAENKYINAMRDYSIMLEDEVTEKTEDIMYVKDMLVLGMADLLENRDSSTGGHIKRTSEVVKIFSNELIKYSDELGVTKLYLERVAKAAPMHDIGKIAIDDKVLRKKGRYTDEEYEKMKKHTVEGAKIIEQIMKNVEDDRIYTIIRNVACYHHEKWNGTGYPEGLKEENIPLEARIMALADVFDALVSKRCYKEAFSYDEAFKIIEESLGEHFDPKLGKMFLNCRKDLEELYNRN
jgi:HD-GYP domain-containing protein (c-di-GMP phosphodiesterase class II)